MSIHPSLKSKSGALAQHRNVLTRTERLAKLEESGRIKTSERGPLGLPKVRSIKVTVAKKPKKEAAAGDAAAAPAAGAPAAAAAAATAAKPTKPTK